VRTPPLTTILADDGVAGLSADRFQGPHAASPEVRTVQLTIARTTVALTDLPVNKGTNGRVRPHRAGLARVPRGVIAGKRRIGIPSGSDAAAEAMPLPPETGESHAAPF
jgi:hypothetical protein